MSMMRDTMKKSTQTKAMSRTKGMESQALMDINAKMMHEQPFKHINRIQHSKLVFAILQIKLESNSKSGAKSWTLNAAIFPVGRSEIICQLQSV